MEENELNGSNARVNSNGGVSGALGATEELSSNGALVSNAQANESTQGLQIEQLQAEIRKMQNEFNTQRAKMKELYMQKDAEYNKCLAEKKLIQQDLDELKSQFVVADLKLENEMHMKDIKAQEEISSLQQLVQDTIEESTICKTELEHLRQESERLLNENRDLRGGQQLQQQQNESTVGLAPQMLNQVKRTLARKLAGDTANNVSFQQDSIDESTRGKAAANQYAHEDAEVLRSIVEQLQEEMKALKEKLREADVQLHAKSTNSNTATAAAAVVLAIDNATSMQNDDVMHKSTSTDLAETTVQCSACKETPFKLDTLRISNEELEMQIDALQKNLAEARENLQKEAALRKDLEDQWQEKREAHKAEVQTLREQVKNNETQLLDMQQKFLETKEDVMRQLQRVTDERENVNKHLETLQADNDFLSGRYLATAAEIENQNINLPNTVVELQELILRQQNEMIQARLNSEFEKQKCVSSLDEIVILRGQLEASNTERRTYKKKVQAEMKSLQDRLTQHMLTVQNYETTKTQLERKEAELNRQLSECRVENIELQDANEKLTKNNSDYKSKIKILQDDLATSEQVQKDFVKLSQTLQMSLEKLRHADSEVRWQDDEDIDNCPTCSTFFTVTVRKIHCRHCGHIYCDKCLTKTVPSGPRKRVARVCDICHTLLTPNTAPYFSHEPLQNN